LVYQSRPRPQSPPLFCYSRLGGLFAQLIKKRFIRMQPFRVSTSLDTL